MTNDSLVTPKAMRALGLRLAYTHVVTILREKGGSADLKDIQDYLARVALMETNISVHTFFKRENWAAFRNGISWVNPTVWSDANKRRYGDALPVFVGRDHTPGVWDLIEVGAASPLPGKPSARRSLLRVIAQFLTGRGSSRTTGQPIQ
jgi:hypothetical protein